MTAPDPACEQAYDEWSAETVLPAEAVNASAVDDIAHEAWCAGWESATATALAGDMHELVFTDRTARPAKWETRCGRTDVPLENAGSADPGMYYPVTCKACLRIAELERLADEMLAEFDMGGPVYSDGQWHRRTGFVSDVTITRWKQIRHSGEAAAAAADELSRLGQEIQGGEPNG